MPYYAIGYCPVEDAWFEEDGPDCIHGKQYVFKSHTAYHKGFTHRQECVHDVPILLPTVKEAARSLVGAAYERSLRKRERAPQAK